LDLTGTEALHHSDNLTEIAQRIRNDVWTQTSISISIGGGTSRIIAKLAARKAKPAGVHVVMAGQEDQFMHDIPLAAIPGVGPKFQERLRAYGLQTVADALTFDVAMLTSWFGEATGEWLYDRMPGIHGGPVEPHSVAKSIRRDETFARDLNTDDALLVELARLAGDAAAELRGRSLRTRT